MNCISEGNEPLRAVELREEDLPALAELYRQFRGERSAPERMREVFRRLVRNRQYTILGVKHQGRMVGSAMAILCEELYGECRPFLVIEDVIVDEKHRRRGIGSRLMRALEERARTSGCAYIMLVTDAARHEAIAFYRSLGYHPRRYRGFKKYLLHIGE